MAGTVWTVPYPMIKAPASPEDGEGFLVEFNTARADGPLFPLRFVFPSGVSIVSAFLVAPLSASVLVFNPARSLRDHVALVLGFFHVHHGIHHDDLILGVEIRTVVVGVFHTHIVPSQA